MFGFVWPVLLCCYCFLLVEYCLFCGFVIWCLLLVSLLSLVL